MKKFLIYIILFFSIALDISCKKAVDVPPPTSQITTEFVYASDETAKAVVDGLLSSMMSQPMGFASGGITLYAGLSADEFENYSSASTQGEFRNNSLTSNNSINEALWSQAYNYIYTCNSILEGLATSTKITPAISKQLEGEARFLRAFLNFYLLNLYGDIPLTENTDYSLNAVIARTTTNKIYQAILEDLNKAKNLLSANLLQANSMRVYPSSWAVQAMLSKVNLYMRNWAAAELAATAVINETSLFDLVDDPARVFEPGNRETIWALAPVVSNYNTWEGNLFILNSSPRSVALTSSMMNAFETGDKRKLNWIATYITTSDTFYYPNKYKIKTTAANTENYVVLRLAEQYLIRAEARLEGGDIVGALEDVNTIRLRAGLSPLVGLTPDQCREEIIQERQIELLCEWGNRWFDLKRTGTASGVLNSIKPGWSNDDLLYPIPFSQILKDPALVQNPGY